MDGGAAEAADGVREVLGHDVMITGGGFAANGDLTGNTVTFVEISGRQNIIGRYLGPSYWITIERIADDGVDADVFDAGTEGMIVIDAI